MSYPSLPLRAGNPASFPTTPHERATRSLLQSVQGGVLASSGRGTHGALLFFRFADPTDYEENAESVHSAAERVTSAWDQYRTGTKYAAVKDEPEAKAKFVWPSFRTLALSGAGLAACGFRRRDHGRNPGEGRTPPDYNEHFWKGMYNELRKEDESADAEGSARYRESYAWRPEYKKRFGGVWQIGEGSEDALQNSLVTMRKWCRDAGMPVVHEEIGIDWRPDGTSREPFGFADGISVPRFFDYDSTNLMGGKKSPPDGEGDVELSEIYLGSELHRGGTFLVFKKLDQNVVAFRENATASQLAARVGRQTDGTPLCPAATQAEIRSGTRAINDFDFKGDKTPPPACPFHSHVRRANPRGHVTAGGGRERLVRRSWVYGSKEDLENPAGVSGGVGLLFISYTADIDVFRRVNGNWMTSDKHPVPGGAPEGDPVMHGRSNGKRFVTPLGGEYYYLPSMTWLRSAKQRYLASLAIA